MEYSQFSPEQRSQTRMQIIAHAAVALPVGANSFDKHTLVKAFRDGIDLCLGPSTSLLQQFGTFSKSLWAMLARRAPEDGSSIEESGCLHFVSSVNRGKQPYVDKWKSLFYRYLKGIGHPCHVELLPVITPEEYAQYNED